MQSEFEAVIGLEVHCQLATESKIFCGCRAKLPEGKSVSEIEPNSQICPVCVGHPGTLPVLNKKVVEYAIKAGIATHCRINLKSTFSRKNYFYPDLPKGYQISQYEDPICEEGWLEIETLHGPKRVRIQRIHMEEDAGKNIHMSGYSLINLNRAGVPLIEIVTAPDLHSAEEAGASLRTLHSIVTYLEICDGNMQEGNFRCDANVSVKLRSAKELGTRVEIKNVNSFRFVEKAIDFEIARQCEVIRGGGKVFQETRGYDSARNVTTVMRSKEEAQDYRYFSDPDLIPLQIENAWIQKIAASLPELPDQKRARMIDELGLSTYDAGVLTSSKPLAHFFESVVQSLVRGGLDAKTAAKPAANWVSGELVRLANEDHLNMEQMKLKPEELARVIRMVLDQDLSHTGAKQVVGIAWKTGESIQSIMSRLGLKQVSDTGVLETVVNQIIVSFPGQVAEYRSGKEKLLGFFVGQAMKEMGGKANPALLGELLKKKLSKS